MIKGGSAGARRSGAAIAALALLAVPLSHARSAAASETMPPVAL